MDLIEILDCLEKENTESQLIQLWQETEGLDSQFSRQDWNCLSRAFTRAFQSAKPERLKQEFPYDFLPKAEKRNFKRVIKETDKLMNELGLSEDIGRQLLRERFRVASRWCLSPGQLKAFKRFLSNKREENEAKRKGLIEEIGMLSPKVKWSQRKSEEYLGTKLQIAPLDSLVKLVSFLKNLASQEQLSLFPEL